MTGNGAAGTGGETAGIHVDDLGEPDPNPPFSEDELEGDAAGDDQAETPPITDDEAGHLLGEVLAIPFEWAGRLYAARAPALVALQVADLWPLPADEADRIGGRLWAAIPARFRDRGRRVLEASPAALAFGSIAQAVRRRQAATRLLYQWAKAQEHSTDGQQPPPAQPAAPADRPSAGDAGGGDDRGPGAAGQPMDPADAGAAGLGLSGIVQRGAAERRERRRRAEAAD